MLAALLLLQGCGLIDRFAHHGSAVHKTLGSSKRNPELSNYEPPELIDPLPSPIGAESSRDIAVCSHKLAIPREVLALADATNFGNRLQNDHWGRQLTAEPRIIVIHETVLSKDSTIKLFKTPHISDDEQVSYHLIIGRDGLLYRIVPDENRAYGAGMSAFGDVTQRSKPGAVGSINNISLHISLVSPEGGQDGTDAHSGYTVPQYHTLASQVLLWQGKYGIPLTRVTTHASVDRSHSRYDPRSFRWDYFDREYHLAAKRCGWERFDKHEASI